MAQTKSKSRPKSKSKPKAKARPKASSQQGPAAKATDKVGTVANGAIKKAKTPLVAGGAALAGAAGGLAVGARVRRHGRHSRIERAVKLAAELQRARSSGNGTARHRSPVEVVLEGLTARRSRA